MIFSMIIEHLTSVIYSLCTYIIVVGENWISSFQQQLFRYRGSISFCGAPHFSLTQWRADAPWFQGVRILALKVNFRVFSEVKILASFLRCFPNISTLHIESGLHARPSIAYQPTWEHHAKFWPSGRRSVQLNAGHHASRGWFSTSSERIKRSLDSSSSSPGMRMSFSLCCLCRSTKFLPHLSRWMRWLTDPGVLSFEHGPLMCCWYRLKWTLLGTCRKHWTLPSTTLLFVAERTV